MPKNLPPDPKWAAAAHLPHLPADESIRDITDNISGTIQQCTPPPHLCRRHRILHIENNALTTDKEAGSDLLTLTNGQYSTIYPLAKGETSGVGSIEISDPVMRHGVLLTFGFAIDLPAPAQRL